MNLEARYEMGLKMISGMPFSGFTEENFSSMPEYLYTGCSKRLWNCDFNDLISKLKEIEENTCAVKELESYIENLNTHIENGTGLYISGPSGIGKSTILTHIIRKSNGFYYDTTDLISTIKSGWSNNNIKEFVDYITNSTSILAIDDFAVFDYKNQGEDMRHYMGMFLKRYNLMKPVIFASNNSINSLKDNFLQSRLQDYVQIKLVGKDLRG